MIFGWPNAWRQSIEEDRSWRVFVDAIHAAAANKMALVVPKGLASFPESNEKVGKTKISQSDRQFTAHRLFLLFAFLPLFLLLFPLSISFLPNELIFLFLSSSYFPFFCSPDRFPASSTFGGSFTTAACWCCCRSCCASTARGAIARCVSSPSPNSKTTRSRWRKISKLHSIIYVSTPKLKWSKWLVQYYSQELLEPRKQ